MVEQGFPKQKALLSIYGPLTSCKVSRKSLEPILIIFQGLNLYFQGHISELHTKTSLTSGCDNEKYHSYYTGEQGIPNQVQTKVQPLCFWTLLKVLYTRINICTLPIYMH